MRDTLRRWQCYTPPLPRAKISATGGFTMGATGPFRGGVVPTPLRHTQNCSVATPWSATGGPLLYTSPTPTRYFQGLGGGGVKNLAPKRLKAESFLSLSVDFGQKVNLIYFVNFLVDSFFGGGESIPACFSRNKSTPDRIWVDKFGTIARA